jgi:hypothetical protein
MRSCSHCCTSMFDVRVVLDFATTFHGARRRPGRGDAAPAAQSDAHGIDTKRAVSLTLAVAATAAASAVVIVVGSESSAGHVAEPAAVDLARAAERFMNVSVFRPAGAANARAFLSS